MYGLNCKTHCYHIRGYCVHASRHGNEWYTTETELKQRDTDAWLCKICQKKREEKEKQGET